MKVELTKEETEATQRVLLAVRELNEALREVARLNLTATMNMGRTRYEGDHFPSNHIRVRVTASIGFEGRPTEE